MEDGTVIQGVTDKSGYTKRVSTGHQSKKLNLTIDDDPYDEQIVLYDATTGERLVDTDYRIEFPDGTSICGKTNQKGCTQRIKTGNIAKEMKLYLK